MKKFYTIFLCLMVCSQAYAIPNVQVLMSIHDKSKNEYELRTISDLKQGRAYIIYKVVSKKNEEGEINIFSSDYDGESGGCNRHELLNINRAVVSEKYEIKDINMDNYDDIVFSFIEENCITKKHIYYNILLIVKDKGFELKKTITREK